MLMKGDVAEGLLLPLLGHGRRLKGLVVPVNIAIWCNSQTGATSQFGGGL
jgi:hypothetical protein